MDMRVVLLVAGLLASLPSFAQLGGLKAAFVSEARGNVGGQFGAAGNPRALKKGQRVAPGMVIESEEDSDTALGFPDGQVAVLGSKGRLGFNDYAYDAANPASGAINMNLIEGNLRVVMGEIAEVNPASLRLQVGTASVGLLPSNSSVPTDISMVSLGGAVAVTVEQGLLEVHLPNGPVIKVATGQTLYIDQNGEPQLDTTANIMGLLGQSALGTQIRSQLAESRGFNAAVADAQSAMAPVTAGLKNVASLQNSANVSGQSGASGQAGERGQAGEQGQSGAQGQSGTQGQGSEQGQSGTQGQTGTQGQANSQGQGNQPGLAGVLGLSNEQFVATVPDPAAREIIMVLLDPSDLPAPAAGESPLTIAQNTPPTGAGGGGKPFCGASCN